MNKKKSIIILITTFLSIFAIIVSFFIGFALKPEKIVYLSLENDKISEEIEQKYDFLPAEISLYIEQLSKELEIDPDLAVAILIVENPEFNPLAEHKNNNGTIDCGLFQLNDKYIWSEFVPNYWKVPGVEFNPFNYKHNTFIALHLIKDLQSKIKVLDDVIASYNAGAFAVMNNSIPESTKYYVASVKNNLNLLQKVQK